ncbi:hypothetical protein M885DRAFT_613496 [Pelagophyceae sp. CCMP2097]|nr:hypothetical protein M885DRAFT_613496 [Pelagophyceae sp. CCMP2097]
MRRALVLAAALAVASGLNGLSKPPKRAPSKKAPQRVIEPVALEEVVLPPVAPSVHATALDCTFFETCAGCSVNDGFDKTPVSATHGWRTQARLAAAPLGKAALAARSRSTNRKAWRSGVGLGLYRTGTHVVEPIARGCLVHAPQVEKAAVALEDACAAAGIRGCFDDKFDDRAELRYAQFAVDGSTGKVTLTLVWNALGFREAAPQLGRLVSAVWDPEVFGSVWVNFRTGPGNAIFSFEPTRWLRLKGSEFSRERLFDLEQAAEAKQLGLDPNVELRFSPLVFRQANFKGFASLVLRLSRWVPDKADVCELYCGVGTIGLALRPKVSRLRCSESNGNAQKCFEASAKDQETRLRRLAPAKFRAADAAEAIKADAGGATVIIVDPPRKGLDAEVLQALCDETTCSSAQRLIYVSCGFDALERDLATLLKTKWTLKHAEGHVLFPGSDHVETLAILDRKR